ncbi:MAG: hypothetical protein M3O85_01250 [Acidobacteriota bacterium]|nr:hypothetical protein [Acidobacteriota bacterium]
MELRAPRALVLRASRPGRGSPGQAGARLLAGLCRRGPARPLRPGAAGRRGGHRQEPTSRRHPPAAGGTAQGD